MIGRVLLETIDFFFLSKNVPNKNLAFLDNLIKFPIDF